MSPTMTMRSSSAVGAVGVCLFLAISLLPVACSRKDPAAERDFRLKRGDAFVAEKKIPEARFEYRLAVTADAKSVEARSKLARAYLQEGDGTGAMREYVNAADRHSAASGRQVRGRGDARQQGPG